MSPTGDSFFMTAQDIRAEYGIDLITAETLRNSFIEVTRHMHSTLLRSSYSNIIRDGMDFGVCVHVVRDDGTTDMVGITEGCTQFAFTHQHLVNMVLDEYGIENLGEGDTLVTNDAYRSGIHFGDLNFLRVIHDEDGKPAFVVSNGAHVFDIGGPVAGGFNHQATTLYEEGLRIPPMLITAGEVPVRPVINLLVENTRSPFHMVGDVKAMLGTLRAGETRLREIMTRYGSGSVKAAAHYTLDLAERRMRKALLAVPDGDYEAEDALDDDGLVYEPLNLKVTVRVRGAEAEIDFSGTDRQPLGSLNSCWEEAGRCIIGPKMTLDPRHPMNAGAMRPFHVLLPAGSVVLALPPSSQSNHVDLGGVMPSLMMQAMSKAAPEAAAAPDAGVTGALLVHGMDTRPGREGMPFGSAFLFGEAWGGTQVCDGISFCFSPLYNVRTIVIEYAERETPLVVWEFGLVQDSAGAGRFRGGFSPSYTFEAFGDSYVTPMLDRVRRPAFGAAGGGPGMTTYGFLVEKDEHGSPVSWNGILPAERMTKLYGIYDDEGRPDPVDGVLGQGAKYMTSKVAGYHLTPGDVLRVMGASPGGYGNPLEREPERVLADVANERISPGQAERTYGVVLEAGALRVDEEATAERRRELFARQAAGEWEPPLAVCSPWPVTDAELAEIASAVAGAHLQTEAS